MPNCDFYAIDKDLSDVLSFVFDELEVRVFELSSGYDRELREFNSISELYESYRIGECKGNTSSVNLQLWPTTALGEIKINRITLNSKSCNGAEFRHQISGWGLIQLYLGGKSKSGIVHSHTNHNSEKRALKWSSSSEDQGAVSSWIWEEVNRVSSKLNRHIKKLAVSNINSRPVMPNAHMAIEGGDNVL